MLKCCLSSTIETGHGGWEYLQDRLVRTSTHSYPFLKDAITLLLERKSPEIESAFITIQVRYPRSDAEEALEYPVCDMSPISRMDRAEEDLDR
jgi:hypothetical protein